MRQAKTRQGNHIRQYKTRQDKSTQHKTIPNNVRQDMAIQAKTTQDMGRQVNIIQDKAI